MYSIDLRKPHVAFGGNGLGADGVRATQERPATEKMGCRSVPTSEAHDRARGGTQWSLYVYQSVGKGTIAYIAQPGPASPPRPSPPWLPPPGPALRPAGPLI